MTRMTRIGGERLRSARRTPYNIGEIRVIRGAPTKFVSTCHAVGLAKADSWLNLEKSVVARRNDQHPSRVCSPSRGGEANDLLFACDGECAFRRRQKSFLDVFLGARNQIAAATQVDLVFNIFAMALNGLYTEMK
jgi:hypothetical protein